MSKNPLNNSLNNPRFGPKSSRIYFLNNPRFESKDPRKKSLSLYFLQKFFNKSTI